MKDPCKLHSNEAYKGLGGPGGTTLLPFTLRKRMLVVVVLRSAFRRTYSTLEWISDTQLAYCDKLKRFYQIIVVSITTPSLSVNALQSVLQLERQPIQRCRCSP